METLEFIRIEHSHAISIASVLDPWKRLEDTALTGQSPVVPLASRSSAVGMTEEMLTLRA
jgi:hypothetical protein